MNEKKVGARIAELRKIHGYTQAELAEQLGVTDGAVSKWENGNCYPDMDLLPKLMDVFGATSDYLLCGESLFMQKLVCVNGLSEIENETINKKYLDDGWRIADMKMCGEEGDYLIALVLEKPYFEI